MAAEVGARLHDRNNRARTLIPPHIPTIFIFLYVAPGKVENIDPPSLEGPGWLRGDPPWWVSGTEGGARMV